MQPSQPIPHEQCVQEARDSLLHGGVQEINSRFRRSKCGDEVNADWESIKNEYITTSLSQRELAKKHGVSQSSMTRRCRAEKWDELRSSNRLKATQNASEIFVESQTNRIQLLMQGGEKAAVILCKYLDKVADRDNIKPQDIRAATEALRSVRELFRTDETSTDDKLRKVRELLGGVPDALD